MADHVSNETFLFFSEASVGSIAVAPMAKPEFLRNFLLSIALNFKKVLGQLIWSVKLSIENRDSNFILFFVLRPEN